MPGNTAERHVLWGLRELGYCMLAEGMLRREHPNPGLLAIEIAERHELRLETQEWDGETTYKFTPIGDCVQRRIGRYNCRDSRCFLPMCAQ